MAYTIEVTSGARRQLKRLDHDMQRRVGRRIEALAEDPRPPGVVKLTDVDPPLFRVREGAYRIVYAVKADRLVVIVVRIAHRSNAYR